MFKASKNGTRAREVNQQLIQASEIVEVNRLASEHLHEYVQEIASLRISVFKEFPYLYDGDIGYEEKYLQSYKDSEESCLVLAKKQGVVIGAGTGLPLCQAEAEWQKPFIELGIDVTQIFYIGEVLFLPEFRAQGLGKQVLNK